jgi:putative effector of murein hydrolase
MLEEVIIFLILYTVLVFTDLVPVYKAKKKKTIIFCTGVFAIALVLQFLLILNVPLPRYADLFELVVKGITGIGVK